MKEKIILFIIIIVGITIAGISLFFFEGNEKEFRLIPREKETSEVTGEVIGTEVGTGWSTRENPEEAVVEAVNMALQGKMDKTPDFVIIFASSGSDIQKIFSKIRELFGNDTKIYGGTSDSRAVMTEKGFIKVTERGYEQALMEGKRGLAIMTITSEDIVFGVGSANFSAFSSVQEASKTAVLNAIKNAGKSPNEKPRIVLLMPTIGVEEEAIEGIEEVVGKDTPIFGGTTGGSIMGVFGENRVYDKGISLAVIYTNLSVGWTFEGGFDVTDPHFGIVTKTDGQAIVEIDNKPALDVYDEWLGGEINKLYKEGAEFDVIRDLLTLHPVYRKYVSSSGQEYFLFSHPWPKDETLKDKSIMTSTKIKVGEKIYLSHGTWEIFVNRIGNLPRNAKIKGEIDIDKKPIFGIAYICAGVMGVIPENEREKLPLLINYANKGAPFIATFTWGEQGFFPGIGSKHGNLLTSFIVISK
ncbi:MAG: FIST N-terminal domain-containing protein [Candidatus Aenigmatarchaeota archaeon]